jgi:signal transduction histidine kinase
VKEKALQILLVEDNAGDARLLREMFSKEKPDSFKLTHLLRMSEAEIHLAKGEVDIVLLDMGLPDGHGLDTVRRARAAAPGIPMIVLTGLDDERLAAEAMKEGAQDYLIKGQIENRALPRALRHAIERHRMQTETDLIRTNQLQFKDEFLSHVSHELRSPLTAIYQFVTILLDNLAGELNQQQREYTEIVLRNVKQLQSMINDLLEVTRVQTGKPMIELQCTSVADAIDYVVNTLEGAAAAKKINLSSDIEKGLPSICADPMRVRQILIVLVDNAIKFTPPNGVVKVQARRLEDPNFLVLEVSDSGCGISPDMTERIFERLFQAPDPAAAGRKGLGLGLHICQELVTRQGGQIWARSVEGQGSVFSVTMPVFSLANLIAPALKRERHTEGPLVLVVTELASQTGWLSNQARAEQSHIFGDLLRRCLHSDMDVLLPKVSSAGDVELYFIVAVTDGIGGEAITKRIREKLDDEQIRESGLTLSTSFRSLEAIKRNASESMEDFLEKVANQIQALINEAISLRMVGNEQQENSHC